MRSVKHRSDPADPPVAERIGSRLRAARLRAGLTQQQLAGERYTKAYVSALENGLARPSMAALEYLAGRLGVSAPSLIGDGGPLWTRLETDVHLAAGRWQEAADGYESLLAGPDAAGIRPELLLGLAEARCRLDQGAEAITAATEAAETFGRIGRRLDAARANYWLAFALYERDHTEEARSLLRSILDDLRRDLEAEPDFKLRVLIALAAVEVRDAEHAKALDYLEEARGLIGDLDDRRRATFLFSLAAAHREAGDIEAAIRLGTQSLALYRAAHADVEAASLENDLALAYLALGNLARARDLAGSARARFDELRDERLLAHVAETQAQIDLADGKLHGASQHADEALSLAERTGNRKAALSARLTRAAILRRKGLNAEAVAEYERAADLARSSASRARLRTVLRAWADALADLGQHENAYRLAREALDA
ncbi:MAG TPA: tetratricopeptide repeat protein [Candidatus Limnocylindrales bacterium]|jgi:transcriptional regulator with XRE-family HTH domain|nr:tetratricopeptide repeat protein [Candidatus Limnocylindrales bacterium]